MRDMNGHTSLTPTGFFRISVNGMFRLVTLALDPLLRIFYLELSLGRFPLATFARPLSPKIFANLGGGPFPEAQGATIDGP